jgi:N-methylhydantoinase A
VLHPDRFGSGGIRLDVEAASKAIAEQIGAPLGLDTVVAARAVRVVFDSAMADLVRSVTIERGHDPREFTLIAGGGSGPSHAWALCRELGLDSFVVPATATAQSAFGAGTSDLRTTASRAVYSRLLPGLRPDEDVAAAVSDALADTRRRALEVMPGPDSADVVCTVAVRYHGQAHHLDIDVIESPSAGDLSKVLDSFEAEYERLYGAGAGFREAGFELLSVRAVASRPQELRTGSAAGDLFALIETRPVVFDDPAMPELCDVYAAEQPAPGQRVTGPCLIELPGCVVVVPPAGSASTDKLGLIHVEVGS